MLDKQEKVNAGRNQYGTTSNPPADNSTALAPFCPWPRVIKNTEGRNRYGTISNANPKCSRCGAGLGPDGALGIEHGNDLYCVDCAVQKGYVDKKDVENSTCPSCKCDMGDHDGDGRCDNCGKQCG